MSDDEKPHFVKIVQRVAVNNADPVSDLALIDIIEVYLGIGMSKPSARARLAGAAEEIKRAGDIVDEASYQTILDVVERLRKVEELLNANGFTNESGS